MPDLAREIAHAFERVLACLDLLEIRYLVGGSLASSIHGIARSTRDIDVVAAIAADQVTDLATELSREFYIDPETAREALRLGRSFNLIHFTTSHKFDIFPLPNDPYYRTQLDRSELKSVIFAEGVAVECPVATAEDTILTKLVWYRRGGEQFDQQWNDLRGILAVQGTRLDFVYMTKWAPHLRVADLLDRLATELLP